MTLETATRQWVVFAFMAVVTSAVLGLLIAELGEGARRLPGIVVYGVTASFGIEFLARSWPSLWGPSVR